MFGVGSVELLILSILPIVVVFVLLYLVIKWTVSSALRGVSSAFREASAGDHTARQILGTSATPGAIRQGRDSGARSTSRYAGT